MADNWSRFTEEVQEALGQSMVYALQYPDKSSVNTTHVFLSLLDQPDCEATLLLTQASISVDKLIADITKAFPPIQTNAESKTYNLDRQIDLSSEIKEVLTYAVLEAQKNDDYYVNSRYLLAGMLHTKSSPVSQILENNGFTLDKIHSLPQLKKEKRAPSLSTQKTRSKYKFSISPIFLLLILVTCLMGILIYNGHTWNNVAVFIFVLSGWVVSLALHEFGHAITAFFSGDYSVAQKGYLALNPLKYTHGWMSLIFPILIMIAGGIGLPGAAVYVNRAAISSRFKQSLVSASGPLATLCFTALLSIPFFLKLHPINTSPYHLEFWAALALLLYLQITAFIFNLLPIPGFDGFNILRPWLPSELTSITDSMSKYTMLVFMVIFFSNNPLRDTFWATIDWVSLSVNLNTSLVHFGYYLFQFWET